MRNVDWKKVCLSVVGSQLVLSAASFAGRTAGWHPVACEALTASWANQAAYRIEQLERKVAGMQKQITILHAKVEASEKKLQTTRNQTANIAMKLRKQIRATWN